MKAKNAAPVLSAEYLESATSKVRASARPKQAEGGIRVPTSNRREEL